MGREVRGVGTRGGFVKDRVDPGVVGGGNRGCLGGTRVSIEKL